jgi:hypothetical protein
MNRLLPRSSGIVGKELIFGAGYLLAALLAAVFAPGSPYRYTLFGATAIEAVTFVSVFFIWFTGVP